MDANKEGKVRDFAVICSLKPCIAIVQEPSIGLPFAGREDGSKSKRRNKRHQERCVVAISGFFRAIDLSDYDGTVMSLALSNNKASTRRQTSPWQDFS